MTGRRTPAIEVRVPAKVNLELRVGPPGEDGFHPLATVFHAVDLTDELTITPAREWSVRTTGPYAGVVPDDGDNLALRAARALAEDAGVDIPVRIVVEDGDIMLIKAGAAKS